MTGQLRELERVERRALTALRCIDATTRAPIDEPLIVSAPGARLVRNRTGLYVVRSWTRLATHETAFDQPPAAPPIGSESLTLDVRDPSGRYLSRRVTVALPRDPSPARAGQADSLFRPVDVEMFPGASAPVSARSLLETMSGRIAWPIRPVAPRTAMPATDYSASRVKNRFTPSSQESSRG